MPTTNPHRGWDPLLHVRLSRRRFLLVSSSIVATSLFGCADNDDDDQHENPTATSSSGGTPGAVTTPDFAGTATAGTTPPSGVTPDSGVTATTGATVITIEQFMQLSHVLTGFSDLTDTQSGQLYLQAISANPEQGEQLAALWSTAGFGEAAPPTSVADLEAKGVYDDEGLAEIADLVTGDWYTGMYSTGDDQVQVATYTTALAWRSLGYRQTGPSSCGGAFGHWSTAPAA